jgi:hypothetical protein
MKRYETFVSDHPYAAVLTSVGCGVILGTIFRVTTLIRLASLAYRRSGHER